jgi:endonuclease G, mitochondrial
MFKKIILFVFSTISLFAAPCEYREFYPQTEQLIERDGYSLLYSSEHKHPRWVFEHVVSENFNENSSRYNDFESDERVFSPSRSYDDDYRGSGFDRGHNACSSNFKYNQKLRDETFLFSNITPQDHSLNNMAWNKLEQYIEKKIKSSDGDAFIVTGSAYIPIINKKGKKEVHYEVIGNNVTVPTHFFKVFMQRDSWGVITNVECYLMPNTSKPKKFKEYQVSIQEIEAKTNLWFPMEYKNFN